MKNLYRSHTVRTLVVVLAAVSALGAPWKWG